MTMKLLTSRGCRQRGSCVLSCSASGLTEHEPTRSLAQTRSEHVVIERSAQSESRATQHSSLPADDPNRAVEVTAVVVTYNSARHLEALGCALASGPLPTTRMLAVDNASTDDTVVRARAAGFEVMEAGRNNGFGAACNMGLAVTSTDFVLFCNPDSRPTHDALARLTRALIRNPHAAIVGPALDDPVRARRFAKIASDIWIFLPSWLQSRLKVFGREVPIDDTQDQVVVDYAIGAFILCRTTALRAVGGFDERFFLYCEEEDLSRRLGMMGWDTLLVPAARVTHQTSTSSEGGDGKAMAPFLLYSLYWYYRKHRSRAYAEIARCVTAGCVIGDRAFRMLTRQRQRYGLRTALAPFTNIDTLRERYETNAD